MDRRKFLTNASVAAAVGTSPSVFAASAPEPPLLLGTQTSSPTSIAIAVKRYDGGSGTAVFSGTVPLKPGQLFDAGVRNVAVVEAGQDLPATVQPLTPRHPDGSLKVVHVHVQLPLGSGEIRPLQLRLDRSPSNSISPATIDVAWMRQPRLLGCTDPAHMCSSRVAPFPLVPANHPNLPEQWRKLLTTEFDRVDKDFPSFGNALRSLRSGEPWSGTGGGNANYEALSAAYYRYMTSGDIDKLADANFVATHGFQYTVQKMTHGNGTVKYTEDINGFKAGDNFIVDHEYNEPQGSYSDTLSEWNSGFRMDMYNCYCMSGWPQAQGVLVADGLRGVRSQTDDASPYGARFDWRLRRTNALFYGLLSMEPRLRYSIPQVFTVEAPSLTNERQSFTDSIQTHHFDKYDDWCRRFPSDDHRYGVWGNAPTFGEGTGLVPNFQLITVFSAILLADLHFLDDGRAPDQLVKLTDLTYGQTHGPYDAWPTGRPLYVAPYMQKDPNQAPKEFVHGSKGNDNFWTVTMLNAMNTYAWAKTGNPKYLDHADANATIEAFVYQTNLGTAGNSWKQIGEMYHMAFHAAAWRAGVPHDGWDPAG